jgi:hypothetical protein
MKQRTTSSDLFANEPPRNNGVGVVDPDDIRARLHKMLAEARAMANWLPTAEAEQLRLEFRTEMERLSLVDKF